jgi:hypothetical protein
MNLPFERGQQVTRTSSRMGNHAKLPAAPTQHFITNKRPYNPRFVFQKDI